MLTQEGIFHNTFVRLHENLILFYRIDKNDLHLIEERKENNKNILNMIEVNRKKRIGICWTNDYLNVDILHVQKDKVSLIKTCQTKELNNDIAIDIESITKLP